MRLFFVLLVLLNALALASIQGWLGSSAPRGEPERITNQLYPERIVLRANGDQSGASPVAPEAAGNVIAAPEAMMAASPDACIAYSDLTESQADALLADAERAVPGIASARNTRNTPTAWWVHLPPSGGRAGAERRVNDLRALGITEYFIVPEAGPNQYAVSLGLFKSEAAAEQHLAFLRGKRLRGARITTRTAVEHTLELRGSASALEGLATALVADHPGAVRAECTP